MYRSHTPRRTGFLSAIGLAGIVLVTATPASAQMANNPWSFQQQNRASVAALMRQVEREKINNGSVQLAPTSLICGSDGKSSASGNSTCVILNNSTGQIEIGQDSKGDQAATSSTDTETNDQIHSSADDVLATLEGTLKN